MAGETAYYDIRIRVFDKPLDQLESKVNRFEKKAGGIGQSLKGAFTGIFAAAGVGVLLSQLRDISIEAVNITREFKNMEDAIRFASGERADENMKFLDEIIKELGLDIKSTHKGFKTFQGALMGTSLEGEKGLEIFKAVSKAASVMKLSADQTEGTFLALGQMISKGNVQAEELRGQLGERLPGAFNIFARALGVSTRELNKMLQDGKVIAEDTLPLFAAELNKIFDPGVATAQKSFNADMNRFNNFILEAKITLGEKLIPTIHEFIKIIPQIDFKPLAEAFQSLLRSALGITGLLVDMFSSFDFGIDKANAFQTAINGIATAIKAFTTPIRITTHLIKIGLIEPLKKATDVMIGLIDAFINSKKIFSGLAYMATGQFQTGLDLINEGIREYQNSLSQNKKQDVTGGVVGPSPFGLPTPPKQTTLTPTTSTRNSNVDSTKAGVEKISSATRNVTLNITKLIENLNFTKDPAKNEYDMEEMVKRVLLKAVNDVNLVQ